MRALPTGPSASGCDCTWEVKQMQGRPASTTTAASQLHRLLLLLLPAETALALTVRSSRSPPYQSAGEPDPRVPPRCAAGQAAAWECLLLPPPAPHCRLCCRYCWAAALPAPQTASAACSMRAGLPPAAERPGRKPQWACSALSGCTASREPCLRGCAQMWPAGARNAWCVSALLAMHRAVACWAACAPLMRAIAALEQAATGRKQ